MHTLAYLSTISSALRAVQARLVTSMPLILTSVPSILYTFFLFTKSDMKTILFPIVSTTIYKWCAPLTSLVSQTVVDVLILHLAAMNAHDLREGMTIGAVAGTMVMKGVATKGGAMTGRRPVRTIGRGRPTVIKYG